MLSALNNSQLKTHWGQHKPCLVILTACKQYFNVVWVVFF